MGDGGKTCGRCQASKSLTEFALRGRNHPGQHHSTCRACTSAYWAENAEGRAEYRAARKDVEGPGRRQYRLNNPQRIAAWSKNHHARLRKEALDAYGGRCTCCDEDRYEFLTIDHVHNDGAEHRRTVPAARLPLWLKRNGYPSGFQVLCWNCNAAKQYHGLCPHRRDAALA